MDLHQVALPALIALAVGGGGYVLVDPYLSGERKAAKRKAALRSRAPTGASGGRTQDAAKRRKAIADSLKDLDRATSKKVSFETQMARAGLDWTRPKFYTISAAFGVLAATMAFFVSGNPLMVVALAIIGGLGVPRWFVSSRRKRRMARFLQEFPGAVDIIVRGIKAGIPLTDCMRNIAKDAAEPVKTEFRNIMEAQALGLTIPEATERLMERVPLPEANFFCIVIAIQSKAGGNLAEALTNLSNVLRDRKKMKGKIKAMSSEAKASAGIIGVLPPLVAIFVYLTSPDYMSLLFVTSTGHMVLAGCALWMGAGIFVMKKMINFQF